MTNEKYFGWLGEEYFIMRFGGTRSNDEYDMYKDIIMADGSHIEIKTQVRFKIANAFTVWQTPTQNNIKKCKSVKHLMFVEPGLNQVIRIYECIDRNFKTQKGRNKKGIWQERYLFDISKMALIDERKDEKMWNKMMKVCDTDSKWLV